MRMGFANDIAVWREVAWKVVDIPLTLALSPSSRRGEWNIAFGGEGTCCVRDQWKLRNHKQRTTSIPTPNNVLRN